MSEDEIQKGILPFSFKPTNFADPVIVQDGQGRRFTTSLADVWINAQREERERLLASGQFINKSALIESFLSKDFLLKLSRILEHSTRPKLDRGMILEIIDEALDNALKLPNSQSENIDINTASQSEPRGDTGIESTCRKKSSQNRYKLRPSQ